jgi:hypothetical protein
VVDVVFKEEDTATDDVKIYVIFHQPGTEMAIDMSTYVKEPWVHVSGQWWYLMTDGGRGL